MKRTVIMLIAVVMLIGIVSCGSSGAPLDLTGNWEESPHEDLYMSAHIEEGTIEVYWMDGGDKALYWAGTYDPPTGSGKEYSWVSKNDKVKTSNSGMGSHEDTKEFKYSGDTISFELPQGIPARTVSLKRTDTDYSEGFFPSGSGVLDDKGSPEIVDFGYTVIEGYHTLISYGAVIRNPSPDLAMTRPTVTVTAKAEKGYVIQEDSIVISAIAAGDTIFFAKDIEYQGPVPATVEITVTNGEEDYLYQTDEGPIYLKDLAVKNSFMQMKDGMPFFTGDITNKTGRYISTVMLVVVYFDESGGIVGGTLGSVYDLAPGAAVPFTVTDYKGDYYGGVEFSTFQIYGLEW